MKILILSDSFPPFCSGGADIIASRMAKELQKRGHNILVFSTCRKKEDSGQKNINGLSVLFFCSDYNLKWRGWRGVKNGGSLIGLKKVLNDFEPDVVHAHNVHTYISYASLKLAKQYCKKVFLTIHDVDLFHQDKFSSYIDKNNLVIPEKFNYKLNFIEKLRQLKKTLNPFRNLLIKRYLKDINKILAVSDALKQAMNQNGINNVVVIHNGIDIKDATTDAKSKIKSRFGISKDKKIIFIQGRIGSLKGGNLILPYIKEIKSKFNNFIFVIASKKSDYTERIVKQAEQDNFSDNLFFTDWLDEKDMDLCYSGCDICLIPSICFDSFPNTNLEAMSFKKPVIGTCFGGTSEITIDNKTGYIVNPLNVKKTAEKIISLLINGQQAENFGLAGYNKIRDEFSLKNQIDEILKYY